MWILNKYFREKERERERKRKENDTEIRLFLRSMHDERKIVTLTHRLAMRVCPTSILN